MRSQAHYFKGHPIHPILIPFPIAFLSGALLFDLAGLALGEAALHAVAYYLVPVGIAAGLLAAVPGAIDYARTVPPDSSGKRRALRHGLVNASALVLFGVAFWLRATGATAGFPDAAAGPAAAAAAAAPGWLVLALQAAGAGLLVWGGWMGGTLVYRNQIGVDHRYAGAGKWREASVEHRPGEPVRVAKADELDVDQMKLLRVGDQRIVLARTAAGYVAFDDHCTHRGGSLAGGVTGCGVVHCPWHGSQFDVATGAVRAGPAEEGIGTYRVEVAGDDVRLIL
jgi:nitrite reductase/ring-hydroxylating ferredoxin subunit/uncharacterized membrane protein